MTTRAERNLNAARGVLEDAQDFLKEQQFRWRLGTVPFYALGFGFVGIGLFAVVGYEPLTIVFSAFTALAAFMSIPAGITLLERNGTRDGLLQCRTDVRKAERAVQDAIDRLVEEDK